jgi:hypothetical protein
MFVHLDPVLAVHMAAQKMSLLGRGILEFIHPGEREGMSFGLCRRCRC